MARKMKKMSAHKHIGEANWNETWLDEFKFNTGIDIYGTYRITQCGLDDLAHNLDHDKYRDIEYHIARIMTDWNREEYLIEFESNPTVVPIQFRVDDFKKYFKIKP